MAKINFKLKLLAMIIAGFAAIAPMNAAILNPPATYGGMITCWDRNSNYYSETACYEADEIATIAIKLSSEDPLLMWVTENTSKRNVGIRAWMCNNGEGGCTSDKMTTDYYPEVDWWFFDDQNNYIFSFVMKKMFSAFPVNKLTEGAVAEIHFSLFGFDYDEKTIHEFPTSEVSYQSKAYTGMRTYNGNFTRGYFHSSLYSISGCGHPDAINHHPYMNIDNNSCIFEGEAGSLHWRLTEADGILTIDGKGAMPDCMLYENTTAWHPYSYHLIKEVIIAEGVTSIGDYAFCGCEILESVTIPSSVTSFGEGAFYDCSNITSIDISNKVTSIGDFAFSGCRSLSSIIIPKSVNSIGFGAFQACSALTSIVIPESIKEIEANTFSGCSGLKTINIPPSVTSIGDWAFGSCSALSSIDIPESVTSIGEGAFGFCTGLTSVSIPSSVTSFGQVIFYDCDGIELYQVFWNSPSDVNAGSIGYMSTLSVPAGTKELYEKTSPWMYFTTIIEREGKEITICRNRYALNNNYRGSCIYKKIEAPVEGCMDSTALNYNPVATIEAVEDTCVYQDELPIGEPVYGCTDPGALNYNLNATDYDGSCLYAEEENSYLVKEEDLTETPVDTLGTKPLEECDLTASMEIVSAIISSAKLIEGTNTIIASWEIVQGDKTIPYDVEYTITKSGSTLFFLSIICKNTLKSTDAGVVGYTVSATYDVDYWTGINQPEGKANGLQVYPNPVKDELIIANGKLPISNIQIFDATGRTVGAYRETTTINVSALSKGVYFVKIETTEGVVVKKIVKE